MSHPTRRNRIRHLPPLEPLESRIAPAFLGSVSANTAIFDDVAGASDTLVIDVLGGVLRHNRFTAGDAGFHSDIDFDSSVDGDQTIDATRAFSLTINGNDGDDTVALTVLANGSVTFNGGGQLGDVMAITGTGEEAATWLPGLSYAGSVQVGGGTYSYSAVKGGLQLSSLASVLLQTAVGIDSYTLTGATGELASVGGWQRAALSGVPAIVADLGSADGASSSMQDIFNVNGLPRGLTSLEVKLGSGGDYLDVKGVTDLTGINFAADGGAGGEEDVFNFTGNVQVVLADDALKIPTGQITLNDSFERGQVQSAAPGLTHDISGWTHAGAFEAGGGTIDVTSNAAVIELQQAFLTRTGHADFWLSAKQVNLIGGPGDNVFHVSGYVSGEVRTVHGGGGNDLLEVTSGGTSLGDTSFDYRAAVMAGADGSTSIRFNGGTVSTDDITRLELHAQELTVAGTGAERVTWTPDSFAFGSTASAPHAGSLLIDSGGAPERTLVYHLASQVAGSQAMFTVKDVHELELQTPAGPDYFNLHPGKTAGYSVLDGQTLHGDGQSDLQLLAFTNIAVVKVDLGRNDVQPAADVFSIGAPLANGLARLDVATGDGDDRLDLVGPFTTFALGARPDDGIHFDGGAGSDSIYFYPTAPVTLGNTTLAIGATTPMTHANVEHFGLGYSQAAQVNYSGTGTEDVVWRPDPLRANSGVVTFGDKEVALVGQLGVFSVASLTLVTPAGADDFTMGGVTAGLLVGTVSGSVQQTAIFGQVPTVVIDLAASDGTNVVNDRFAVETLNADGLQNVVVKTGAGDDRLVLSANVTDLRNFTFDAGAGSDTLEATLNVSVVIAPAGLSYTDNARQTANYGQLAFTGAAVENLALNGGPGPNHFVFQHWAGAATVKAGAGNDLIDLSGGFEGVGSFEAGEGDDTFVVQNDAAGSAPGIRGGLGGAFLNGELGIDTIEARGDLSFQLGNNVFKRIIPHRGKSGLADEVVTNAIANIDHATLSGGDSANTLDAQHFSGSVELNGRGGIDNLIAGEGGSELYGFAKYYSASDTALYTRDNFFAGNFSIPDVIHPSSRPGNVLSFRYSQVAVTYTIPGKAPNSQVVGGGHEVELAEGTLTAVEGSSFADHLTGNKAVNFLIGGKGNDVLRAVGFDYLFGGDGRDRLAGVTPFRFQETAYALPGAAGVAAALSPAFYAGHDRAMQRIAALVTGTPG